MMIYHIVPLKSNKSSVSLTFRLLMSLKTKQSCSVLFCKLEKTFEKVLNYSIISILGWPSLLRINWPHLTLRAFIKRQISNLLTLMTSLNSGLRVEGSRFILISCQKVKSLFQKCVICLILKQIPSEINPPTPPRFLE